MASFTPQINPVNPPDFGGKSRAVDIDQGIKPQGVQQNQIMPHGVQQGDESAKYAGEAAAAGIKAGAVGESQYADLFKNAVQTTDFLGKAGVELTKKTIEDKVYQVADAERQKYTDILEKIKAGVGTRNVLDANASGDGTEEEADMPPEVAGLSGRLEGYKSAGDSGKISGSYLQSKYLAEAKSLRAQYPGFREYIDQTFAKVTGSNPANAYIHSMVQDINRATSSSASQKNKMLSFIMNNMDTIPNAPQVFQDYNAGMISDAEVLQKSYPYQKMKADLNMSNLVFTNQKMTNDERTRLAGDNVDRAAGMVVNTAVATLTSKMGLNTIDDLTKLSDMEKAGQIDPKQWQQYGQVIANTKATLITKMTADSDAHGYTTAVGGKAALNERIAQAVKPLDQLLERVYNHDFGGIYDVNKQLTARNDTTKLGLLNDPKIGPWMAVNQATKDLVGEQNLQKFALDTIKGTFNQDFQTYYGNMQKNMVTQYNMKTTGVPYTFNDVITNLKNNKVSDGRFNEQVLKTVDKITDTTLPEAARLNIATGAFAPENRAMISRLAPDSVDKNGRTSSPQTAVFQNFTSPDKTKAMWELAGRNPESPVWKNYQNWAQETFANELMNKEINGLKNIPENSGVQVGWDARNHRFIVNDVMEKSAGIAANQFRGGSGTESTNYFKSVQGTINRMNGNIGNLKNIAEASGTDIDAFVLKTIADSAGRESLSKVNGIPYQLMLNMGLAKMNSQDVNRGR